MVPVASKMTVPEEKEKERKVNSRSLLVEVFFSQVVTDNVHIRSLGRSASPLSAFVLFFLMQG